MSSIFYNLLKIIENTDKLKACRCLTQIEFNYYFIKRFLLKRQKHMPEIVTTVIMLNIAKPEPVDIPFDGVSVVEILFTAFVVVFEVSEVGSVTAAATAVDSEGETDDVEGTVSIGVVVLIILGVLTLFSIFSSS